MAQFKSFEEGIENGGHELPVIALGNMSTSKQNEIRQKYGLKTESGSWNDLQSLLSALEEISYSLGEMNLFLIGKGVTEGANFPPMDSLKTALESLDIAYHMNHRKNGEVMFDPETGKMLEGIGHYILEKYDENQREAEVKCHTPYPSKFEEGILLAITRRFKPKDSIRTKVALDSSKETKREGGESCTFIINW